MYTHDKPRSTFSIFLTPPPMRTLPHIARMEWLNCNSHAWACLPQTHADLREVLARHNTREEQVIRLSPEVPYLNETAEIRWGGNIRVDTFNVQRPTSSLTHLEPSHKRAVGSTIPLRFQVYTGLHCILSSEPFAQTACGNLLRCRGTERLFPAAQRYPCCSCTG